MNRMIWQFLLSRTVLTTLVVAWVSLLHGCGGGYNEQHDGLQAFPPCNCYPGGDTNTKRPNLVFVFADQFRRQAMGFMGEDPVLTPTLDNLSNEGMVFTNAASSLPICSPSRAMLMTGKYPFATGVVRNCNSDPRAVDNYLRANARCVSDILKDAGYCCAYVGKWHLDRPEPPYVESPHDDGLVWDAYTPPAKRHGFDFWYSYGCFNQHWRPHYWYGDLTKFEMITVDEWSPEHEATVANQYIRRCRHKGGNGYTPFAVFVSMNPPHGPYELVPDRYRELYEGKSASDLLNRPNVDLASGDDNTTRAKEDVRNYFAAVSGVDEQLGRILQCLKEEGLEKDTIVVFSSDHGNMMGSHRRMGKAVFYEEAIGIPLIIRWPGMIEVKHEDLLISHADLLPTLLGLMDLGDQIPTGTQGTDYSRILLGGEVTRPTSIPYIQVSNESGSFGHRGLRTGRYTFVVRRDSQGEFPFLYDNKTDPFQLKNVASTHPVLIQTLRRELDQWLMRLDDPWMVDKRATPEN